MTAKVLISKDRQIIKLVSGAWSETITPDLLPGRLALYRGLRDRAKGKYSQFYAPMVEALERAMAKVADGPG